MAEVTTPRLTIGGVVIVAGRFGSFTWPQTLGVEAPRVVWQLPVDAAWKILAGPQEVTIEMRGANGVKKTIKRVYVVGEGNSPDKQRRSVIFSDVRYYLPFGWVKARYNEWIGSGTLRQVTPDSVPQNAGPLAAQNLIFDPNSLKGA